MRRGVVGEREACFLELQVPRGARGDVRAWIGHDRRVVRARRRGEAALYTWFCQICRNVIADHYRRGGRSSGRVALIEDLPNARAILESLAAPAADEPESGAVREQLCRVVAATLDALPGRYGDALEWKYIDGLSVREIARRLGLGEKAAESLLTRARESFRTAIGEII